jgi:hypothetical protein
LAIATTRWNGTSWWANAARSAFLTRPTRSAEREADPAGLGAQLQRRRGPAEAGRERERDVDPAR